MDKSVDINLHRIININEIFLMHEKFRKIKTMKKTQHNEPECYKTDQRYKCSIECEWEKSCKKLTAAWLRS